jgi:rare lipoprotein A
MLRTSLLAAAAVSFLLFAPPGVSLPLVSAATAGEPAARTIVGLASYYGPGFHGRRTASGEIFDMHALVAAHRTLPLDTVARVTNLANGRSVVLRINDRGPYIKGRVLDVSKGAAQALAFVRDGITRVRIEVLSKTGIPRGPWVKWRHANGRDAHPSVPPDLLRRRRG